MAVPGVAGVGDLAGGDLQGGEQRGGAVPDVVMGRPSRGGPGRSGRIGAVRSRAWTCDFSSTHSTTALSGGFEVEPDDVADLGLQLRVGGELERLGAATAAARTPATRPRPSRSTRPAPRPAAATTSASPPAAPAAAPASPARSPHHRSLRGRPGLGRSSSPPMPSAAYRFFHAITVGLDTPVRVTISFVPARQRPAARSGPAAPARPGSTSSAPTRPAPHGRAAEHPRSQSTA